MIDVKNLIISLSNEQLLQSANNYFAKVEIGSEQCWKPFSNPLDATYLTQHLGWLLSAANLFKGAHVVDFGCGTGWLSHALSQMGCHAIGIDISENAIKLAENLADFHKPGRSKAYGSIRFKTYDGLTIPIDNNSLDRIICFDSFHHVRDQKSTINEFYRILKDGGRAIFLEPGPQHSKTAQSQLEMSVHSVIENDVSMEEIATFASGAGFHKPTMLIQYPSPVSIDIDTYLSWSKGHPPANLWKNLLVPLNNHLTNAQCFFLQKGSEAKTSLLKDGLSGKIEIQSRELKNNLLQFRVKVTNTGNSRWLTAAGAGQVNLGLQIIDKQGKMINNDYGRVRLTAGDVSPGDQIELTGVCVYPTDPLHIIQIDLVSELICWFSNVGPTIPAIIQIE